MKRNYLLYIIVFFVVILRGSLINAINNIGTIIFNKNDSLEISVLQNRIIYLEKEYQDLIYFKNNIDIKENYVITNAYLNNYSYDKLLINGTNYKIGDEVVTSDGLIGVINKVYTTYSDVSFITDVKMAVKIGNIEGKIVGKNENNNLIVKELSNYNNININDKVESIYNTYIGKVIKIDKEDIDTSLIVQTVNLDNINYVAVISR